MYAFGPKQNRFSLRGNGVTTPATWISGEVFVVPANYFLILYYVYFRPGPRLKYSLNIGGIADQEWGDIDFIDKIDSTIDPFLWTWESYIEIDEHEHVKVQIYGSQTDPYFYWLRGFLNVKQT